MRCCTFRFMFPSCVLCSVVSFALMNLYINIYLFLVLSPGVGWLPAGYRYAQNLFCAVVTKMQQMWEKNKQIQQFTVSVYERVRRWIGFVSLCKFWSCYWRAKRRCCCWQFYFVFLNSKNITVNFCFIHRCKESKKNSNDTIFHTRLSTLCDACLFCFAFRFLFSLSYRIVVAWRTQCGFFGIFIYQSSYIGSDEFQIL